jgi:catechol 2,3-dioxygenase-like lactoylglutathione lyase family enzyme
MSESRSEIALGQINIVVRDMRKAVSFYRLLGVAIDAPPAEWAAWAAHHINGETSNGVRIELDSVAFAKQWNPALDESRLGSAAMPFFHVASREDVDRTHARVTAAGHRSHKAPEDAFWGARYAIVEDPDGNSVGITSAIDPSMRRTPPPAPGG